MGGTMVFTIAASYPDRIAGVVAIGPVSPNHVNADTFKQRIETVMKGVFGFPHLKRYLMW